MCNREQERAKKENIKPIKHFSPSSANHSRRKYIYRLYSTFQSAELMTVQSHRAPITQVKCGLLGVGVFIIAHLKAFVKLTCVRFEYKLNFSNG